MSKATDKKTDAASVVDHTDMVARLRAGIQWRAEILTAGGTELMRDYEATEALMRQAANRMEELEHVTALSEGECDQIEESCQQMLASLEILSTATGPAKVC